MSRRVTVVMYHYVRDLRFSRYPEIKGLDLSLFREQLEFLRKHYNIIRMEDVIAAVEGHGDLPEKAALMTFDDGYSDHFTNVFPILDGLGLQGSFFVPVRTVREHKVLDVNKIHFILASTEDKNALLESVLTKIEENRAEFDLLSREDYLEKTFKSNRFDTAEVIAVKRLLQVELPEEMRGIIVDDLFSEHVGVDEGSFSRELYMSEDQLKTMLQHGMHIGAHGNNHYWLSRLDRQRKSEEITESVSFLSGIGMDTSQWTMCYPFGDYDEELIGLLRNAKCRLAFTTVVDVARPDASNRFELPRLDTNDMPKSRGAKPNEWFEFA